jgi:hypothetical protein
MAIQARLVARIDECHRAIRPKWIVDHDITTYVEAFAKLVADVATAKEREACAKVCEGFSKTHGLHTKHCVAAAIRARGGEAT